MKLSEIVRRYREEHGLSIRQFAKQCELSHASMANIENEVNSRGHWIHIKMPQTGGVQPGAVPVGKEQNDRKMVFRFIPDREQSLRFRPK